LAQQHNLLDLLHEPPILRPVVSDGSVVRDEPDEVHRLPHPRMAWDYAVIELHQAGNGLWMWSVSHCDDCGNGGGYRVGEKWGRFARSRDDALYYAIEELRDKVARRRRPCKSHRRILDWAERLEAA